MEAECASTAVSDSGQCDDKLDQSANIDDELVNIEYLKTKITHLESEILKYQSRLEASEKHLARKERQLEKANSYNDDLRDEVEKLSAELHSIKSKKVDVSTQVEDQICESTVNVNTDVFVDDENRVKSADSSEEPTIADGADKEKSSKNTLELAVDTEDQDGNKDARSSTSIADDLRATAEAALQQTGYVYDENSGLYYDYKSGYYYDPAKQLFYDPNSGTYFYYNGETEKYEFHSQVDLSQYSEKWQQQQHAEYYQQGHDRHYSGHSSHQHYHQPHYSKYRDRHYDDHHHRYSGESNHRYEDRHSHERHQSSPRKHREQYDKMKRSKDKSPKISEKSEERKHHKKRKSKKKKRCQDRSKKRVEKRKKQELEKKQSKELLSESSQHFDLNAGTSMQSELYFDKENEMSDTKEGDNLAQTSSVLMLYSSDEQGNDGTSDVNEDNEKQLLRDDSDVDKTEIIREEGLESLDLEEEGSYDDGELEEKEAYVDSECGVEEMDAEDSCSYDNYRHNYTNHAIQKKPAVKFVIKNTDKKTDKPVKPTDVFSSESEDSNDDDDDTEEEEEGKICEMNSNSTSSLKCSDINKNSSNNKGEIQKVMSVGSNSGNKEHVRQSYATSQNDTSVSGDEKNVRQFSNSIPRLLPQTGKINKKRCLKRQKCNSKTRELLKSKCQMVKRHDMKGCVKNHSGAKVSSVGESIEVTENSQLREITGMYEKDDSCNNIEDDAENQSRGVKRNIDDKDSSSSSSLCTGESEIESGEITDSSSEDSVILLPSPAKEVIMLSDVSDDEGVIQDTDEDIDDTQVKEEVASTWARCIRVIVTDSDVLDPGMLFIVTCTGATVGREKDMGHTILIPDLNISKSHAEIKYDTEQQKYFITDQGSQNGTFLNEKRLSESKVFSKPSPVNHGDVLQFGCTRLLLHIHPWTETCDECEPGQVQAQLHYQNQENKTKDLVILSKEEKKKMHKEQLKSIKKKYGLKNSAYVDNMAVIKTSGYTDKAEERRKTVGSDNPYQREEAPTSVHRPISEENKGHKLLKKMGWTEGQSLGKDNSGIQEPVQVKFRSKQSAGLGFGGTGEGSIDDVEQIHKRQKWLQAQQRFNQSSGGGST